MRERLRSGDEEDAVWARGILKIFERTGVASKTKRKIRRRRRRNGKMEAKDGEFTV